MKLSWPWSKREERSLQTGLTPQYIDMRRKGLQSDGAAALSATVATAAGVWSRAFSMLQAEPNRDLITPDVLGAIGPDLLLRGESCWHIALGDDGNVRLDPVAYWDELGDGKYHLHIARVNRTESIRALEPEVVKLVINADPARPWKGRSPFQLMGLSPTLLAEIEQTLSGALPFAGKGLLPMPSTIAAEQQGKVLTGLQSGSLAVVTSKADFQHHTGGERSEMRRVELTPDMQRMALQPTHDALHGVILAACGIPPSLFAQGGNAGALRETYRLFALQTVDPLSRQITPELNRKLGVTNLSLRDMMASDTAGRARSESSLVSSGVPLATAMQLCGWEGIPLPDPVKPEVQPEPKSDVQSVAQPDDDKFKGKDRK